jgi:hypothetical protein
LIEARKLAAEGGAIVEPDLVPRVSHIIIGPEATPEALSTIRDHVVEWREHVRTVRLGWLREAVAARCCVEPSPDSAFVLPQLLPRASTALVSMCTTCPGILCFTEHHRMAGAPCMPTPFQPGLT